MLKRMTRPTHLPRLNARDISHGSLDPFMEEYFAGHERAERTFLFVASCVITERVNAGLPVEPHYVWNATADILNYPVKTEHANGTGGGANTMTRLNTPYALPSVPGTFVEGHVRSMRFRRRQIDVGVLMDDSIRCYTAHVPDGVLHVLVASEPAGQAGSHLWHLSISHSASDRHFRLPTWDEIKRARFELIPRDICMAMIMPGTEQEYVDINPWTMHLWEVNKGLAK